MHETERHRVILAAVRTAPMVTVARLVELTGTSEATVRRDIAALEVQGRLARVWGGAKAVDTATAEEVLSHQQKALPTVNLAAKHAIARQAMTLCKDGDSIIINGGSTTYQLVNHLIPRHMQILTNSFAIADALLNFSQNTVLMPGGTINRENSIITSPFDDDGTAGFSAGRMFTSCSGIGPHGILEESPPRIQAGLKLMRRAREVIVMVDSSKFTSTANLVMCGFDQVAMVITDDRIRQDHKQMLIDAGVELVIAKINSRSNQS